MPERREIPSFSAASPGDNPALSRAQLSISWFSFGIVEPLHAQGGGASTFAESP
jgi:hypothetical protein